MLTDKISTVHMYIKNSKENKEQDITYDIRILGLITDELTDKILYDKVGKLKKKLLTSPTKDISEIAQNIDLLGTRLIGAIYKDRVLQNRLFISEKMGMINQVYKYNDKERRYIELCATTANGNYLTLTSTYI